METAIIKGGGNFNFSAVKIQDLGATEYTLVTIALDKSGSMGGFEQGMLRALKSVVAACKKSPRAENLMLRVIEFSDNLEEVHGFKLLNTINPDDYAEAQTGNMTALYDATFSGVGATLTFAKQLIDQDFNVNGIVFIITDGADNRSTATTKMIADRMIKARSGEEIESLITVLIGINTQDPSVVAYLDTFVKEAQLTQYVDAGEATPGKLAKLAAFVSKSISSQSQALGTGVSGSQLLTI